MGEQVLIVVDMQKDFIDGALGTAEAVAVVPKVAEKIKGFDGEVLFTRDTYGADYLETQEGGKLPVPHCIRGTEGWEIDGALRQFVTADTKIFDKPAFGSVELAQYLSRKEGLRCITLIGLCTDICVISNALIIKAFLPEVRVMVDAQCCAGVTPQSHNNALEAMKMCQIEIME